MKRILQTQGGLSPIGGHNLEIQAQQLLAWWTSHAGLFRNVEAKSQMAKSQKPKAKWPKQNNLCMKLNSMAKKCRPRYSGVNTSKNLPLGQTPPGLQFSNFSYTLLLCCFLYCFNLINYFFYKIQKPHKKLRKR